ncbi:MAG: tyrosine-type recombinase/integrase [Bacteroidota bacterium]
MKTIETTKILIGENPMWKLTFPYDKDAVELIKTISGARWQPDGKFWHFPFERGTIEWLNHKFDGKLLFKECTSSADQIKKDVNGEHSVNGATRGISISGARHEDIQAEFMKSLILKQYSPRTIETYTIMLRLFLKYYNDRDVNSLSDEEIREYLLYLLNKKKVSLSYQNQAINAIKYYYEQVLGRVTKTYYLARPKRSIRYPTVLSEEEVIQIIQQTDNLKHRMVISLIYSAGLRIGEAVNLKIEDIDTKMGYILVCAGKGRKDRRTLLSKSILEELRLYYEVYRPNKWVFNGQDGGQYSDESIQAVFRKAVKKSGILKHVTVHTLRHSFATHLLEHGVNLRYIQTLLGNSSSKTTEIYTHVTNKGLFDIKSPLDNLDLGKK